MPFSSMPSSRLSPSIALVLAAATIPAAASPAPPRLTVDKTFGKIAGWSIGYSEGVGGCLAAASYGDGTILWFGIDSTTVIFAVTMILLPFAAINLRTGLIELDSELVELGRSLSRSRPRRFLKLLVPMLVPYIFATLRTSFGVAWKVTLTAELFGGNAGVGYLLNVARQEFDTETIFAIILFIILFVAGVETLFFRPLQRRLDRRYRRV